VKRIPEQIGGMALECSGQSQDIEDADVSFTALDAADVSPMKASHVGQDLLGDA
jgi:hypothetical protein